MARKHHRKYQQPPTTPPPPPAPARKRLLNSQQVFGLRADDLSSTISGVGGYADPLPHLYNTGRVFSTSFGYADAAYRTDEFAVSVIDGLPSEAARAGCQVVVDDGSTQKPEPFRKELQRLDAINVIAQARKWARQYGGAGIVLDVDDGMDPAEPLDPSAIKRINRLIPLDRWALIPSDTSERPEFYTIAAYVAQFDKMAILENSPQFHGSRVIRFIGRRVVPRIRIQLNGWGLSVLDTMWPAIRDFAIVNQSAATISTSLEHGVLAIEGLRDAVRAGADDEIQERLRVLIQSRSTVGTMLIDKDTETFERSTSTAGTGADKLWQVSANRLAGAAGQPVTRMFGQSPSGLSTDDNSGRRWWQCRVSVEQVDEFQPAVKRICDLLVESGGVSLGSDTEYKIEWNPTEVPTAKERAETLAMWATAVEKLVKLGSLSPMEARATFAAVGWSPDIRLLDAETQQAMLDESQEFLLDPKAAQEAEMEAATMPPAPPARM